MKLILCIGVCTIRSNKLIQLFQVKIGAKNWFSFLCGYCLPVEAVLKVLLNNNLGILQERDEVFWFRLKFTLYCSFRDFMADISLNSFLRISVKATLFPECFRWYSRWYTMMIFYTILKMMMTMIMMTTVVMNIIMIIWR